MQARVPVRLAISRCNGRERCRAEAPAARELRKVQGKGARTRNSRLSAAGADVARSRCACVSSLRIFSVARLKKGFRIAARLPGSWIAPILFPTAALPHRGYGL